MLTKLILITLSLFTVKAEAQSFDNLYDSKLKDPEKSIGAVTYDFSYVEDTTRPDFIQKEKMVVEFSTNYSKFYSQLYRTTDSIFSQDLNKALKEQAGQTNINLGMLQTPKGNSAIFITSLKNSKVYQLGLMPGAKYLISSTDPNLIHWKIEDSTRQIGGYTCQKAVGASTGRQYIAWFTTDLPYSFGPRRLFGLPGLILEAYDTTERIKYKFDQFRNISGSQLGLPENGIETTRKEFNKMRRAMQADPNAFLGSRKGRVVVESTFTPSKADSKMQKIMGNPYNFPIDLTQD